MLRNLLASCLMSCAFAQDYYSVVLDGAQEVPPVASTARGWGVVRFDTATSTVRIFVYHEGLTGAPAAAHLHQAPPGANGGIVVPLVAASPDTFTGTAVLPAAVAAALASSGTYVNVHTAAFGGGEIRGQVVPSISTRFTGVLSGAQEVPPNASAATGSVFAFLHEPDNRLVYNVASTGLVGVAAAHVHQAAAGVNGPVLFALNGSAGNYCGVSNRLTAAQVAAIKANGSYVNIHTGALPGGELRAQLIKDLGDHFVARLDGMQEVPPVPSAGLGGGNVVVSPTGIVTVTGGFGGLTSAPGAAHVHVAPIGTNGPVVFPLTLSGANFSGTFAATAAQLANLRTGNWYINVHTPAFPGGEIRGQLTPASLPAPFGGGCVGSNGVRPQSGARGFPSIGSPMNIDLYGALPGGIELFLFGSSRDAAGPVLLPVELPTLGLAAPGCYLLVEPATILVAFADAFGCAELPLTIPFNPALRGLQFYSQWVSLDPAANLGGYVTSSALTLTIQ